jgi:hypothetical protein
MLDIKVLSWDMHTTIGGGASVTWDSKFSTIHSCNYNSNDKVVIERQQLNSHKIRDHYLSKKTRQIRWTT